MVTGDHLLIAKETARLDMNDDIMDARGLPMLDPVTKQNRKISAESTGNIELADGFAEVYPEHKYLIVECLREMGHKVGMTGDGVNDAPALQRADVGIAVEGSDAARLAADIVLTEPGLSTIIHGIIIARCIFERIRNFITYRIAALCSCCSSSSSPSLLLDQQITSRRIKMIIIGQASSMCQLVC